MSKLSLSLAAAVALSFAVNITVAEASELKFVYTGVDGSASWTQLSDPTPLFTFGGYETIIPVVAEGPDSFGNTFDKIYFYTGGHQGGFAVVSALGYDISANGAQLFNGSLEAPLFGTGVFNTVDYFNGSPGTLTVTAVPEASTWAMMLLGFAGWDSSPVVGRQRRRCADLIRDALGFDERAASGRLFSSGGFCLLEGFGVVVGSAHQHQRERHGQRREHGLEGDDLREQRRVAAHLSRQHIGAG
jgi:hypothetical protein